MIEFYDLYPIHWIISFEIIISTERYERTRMNRMMMVQWKHDCNRFLTCLFVVTVLLFQGTNSASFVPTWRQSTTTTTTTTTTTSTTTTTTTDWFQLNKNMMVRRDSYKERNQALKVTNNNFKNQYSKKEEFQSLLDNLVMQYSSQNDTHNMDGDQKYEIMTEITNLLTCHEIANKLDSTVLQFSDADEKERIQIMQQIEQFAIQMHQLQNKYHSPLLSNQEHDVTNHIHKQQPDSESEKLHSLHITPPESLKPTIPVPTIVTNNVHHPVNGPQTQQVNLGSKIINARTDHSNKIKAYSKKEKDGINDATIEPYLMGSSNIDSAQDETEVTASRNELEEIIDKVTESDMHITEEQEEEEVASAEEEVEEVDIAIVGAGIGGLCAGAILNTVYGKKVGIYESHYLPGGCAHAFDRIATIDGKKVEFTFDSGPTIVLGCSSKPYNPLRQVLNVVGVDDQVEWIPYDGWGMIEHPGSSTFDEKRWRVELGRDKFQQGPLTLFGGSADAVKELNDLHQATKGLVTGATDIPAMAMRSGKSALIPLLQYLPSLIGLIQQGPEITQGTFAPFMDGPKFVVKNTWLRNWLDALAFSLSGLPACRTSAAAMAYVLYDMHFRSDKDGSKSTLDYPRGGLGKVIDALVYGVEQGSNQSKVNLKSHVDSIQTSTDGSRVLGLKLKNGKIIKAKDGVICNAPVWSLANLIDNDLAKLRMNELKSMPSKTDMHTPKQTWFVPPSTNTKKGQRSSIKYEQPKSLLNGKTSLLEKCNTSEMTGSFLHLHLALNATGLDLDSMEAHYTVMDRGLEGDGTCTTILDDNDTNNGEEKIVVDGPCGELNMIAVSNPCVLDRSLAPDGTIVVHAYGAGNEPYDVWKNLKRNSAEYLQLKEKRSQVLWKAVESIIPDARDRVMLDLVGSPITHERFLRRPR